MDICLSALGCTPTVGPAVCLPSHANWLCISGDPRGLPLGAAIVKLFYKTFSHFLGFGASQGDSDTFSVCFLKTCKVHMTLCPSC